jgi:hypothetical protein
VVGGILQGEGMERRVRRGLPRGKKGKAAHGDGPHRKGRRCEGDTRITAMMQPLRLSALLKEEEGCEAERRLARIG